MLRFTPDDAMEGLLRPFLLADPTASLYTEIHAPDWRFAALGVFTLIAWAVQRRLGWLTGAQWRTLVGLTICFYVWTWVSGNGRYFLWGLMMVGPLVVMVAQQLPGSQGLRNLAVLGVLALQAGAIWTNFKPNAWGLLPWQTGPGWALEDSSLKAQPAAFLTVGTVSYSILVPQMHPQSRWGNIGGQLDLRPGMREHRQLEELLKAPLPQYVVARAKSTSLDDQRQPTPQARATLGSILAQHQLGIGPGDCQFVRTQDEAAQAQAKRVGPSGFLFCPVVRNNQPVTPGQPVDPAIEGVFEAVERRCPRFFPPSSSRTRASSEGFSRFYVDSDVGLNITNGAEVYFKHIRSLNATVLGSAEQVRNGQFVIDCQRIPGRYAPPWARH